MGKASEKIDKSSLLSELMAVSSPHRPKWPETENADTRIALDEVKAAWKAGKLSNFAGRGPLAKAVISRLKLSVSHHTVTRWLDEA